MLLIRHIKRHAFFQQGCVATIGNFDGLHRGHRAIFECLKQRAKEQGLPCVVVTFEPLPREFFSKSSKQAPICRLTRFKEKWALLKKWGIDVFVCLRFNGALSQLSAAQFVAQVLVQGLNTKHLIVGKDFRFGRDREGDLSFLEKQAKNYHFTLEVAPEVLWEGERISSTWVRTVLQENNLMVAEQLLGRPYSLLGKVIHGDKRARQWGVPTANLNIHRSIISTVLPIKGVYAVVVEGVGLDSTCGVANVGNRPTVNGFRNLLEVHLLDFEGSLYNQVIEVKFLHKVRDEKRFDSLELLKRQILDDVDMVKAFFKSKK